MEEGFSLLGGVDVDVNIVESSEDLALDLKSFIYLFPFFFTPCGHVI